MNDLLQTMALAGGQWAGSTENLEAPVETNGGSGARRMKGLGSMAYSTNAINYATLTLPSGSRAKRSLKIKGRDYRTASRSPLGGVVNYHLGCMCIYYKSHCVSEASHCLIHRKCHFSFISIFPF